MSKLGIDFGTTNSLMVAYDKTKNKFLYFNYDGDTPVPTSSTVWYHDNQIEVGKIARENMQKLSGVEGHFFERSIKSKIGSNEKTSLFGQPVEPYKVASTVLSHLINQAINGHANEAGVDTNRAIFTVPVGFSGKARQELRKSANEAGIDVVSFIHEPFAAIIGHYFSKESHPEYQPLEELRQLEGQYLLTFDWGGGTLDITVVLYKNGKMSEHGTAGCSNMAGDKIDEEIAWLVWNSFLDKHGAKYNSAHLEKIRQKKWGRMLSISEKCKIELSKSQTADFLLDNFTSLHEGIDYTITRSDLEKIMEGMLDEACNCIDKALNEAGVCCGRISHVFLTGGTCYIPAVQKRLAEKFAHRVEAVKNADLLIAQGAAVVAEFGWMPFLAKDIQIEMSDGSFWPILESGTLIATNNSARITEVFTCVDHRQKEAKVIICEGNNQKKDSILAILRVPTLCDSRFGDDIIVDTELDKDIILTVNSWSKMIHGYGKDENYAIKKSAEIVKICFGLDINKE